MNKKKEYFFCISLYTTYYFIKLKFGTKKWIIALEQLGYAFVFATLVI